MNKIIHVIQYRANSFMLFNVNNVSNYSGIYLYILIKIDVNLLLRK